MSGEKDTKRAFFEALGHFLKMQRLDQNKTQEELGIAVGYSPAVAKQAISQVERGITGIPAKKLDEFVRELDLTKGIFQMVNYHASVNDYDAALKLIESQMNQEVREKTGKLIRKDGELKVETPEAPTQNELEQKLTRLKTLHTAGLITQEDYDESRKKLLDSFLGL